jgi:hypothetical protein
VTFFGQVTVRSTYPGTKLVEGSIDNPTPVLIVNTDPVNTVYVSENLAYLPGDTTQTTPIPPNASVVFNGASDVFAIAAAGTSAAVSVFPSGIAYTQPAAITPLAQKGSFSGSSAGTITVVTSFTVMSLVDVTSFASYDINLFTFNVSPGAVGAPVTTQVNLQWFDDLVSGIPVFQEMWFIWNGRAVPSSVFNTLSGCGPMHGRYLTITLFIAPSSASNVTVQYVNVYGSNRVVPYSDWRQNAQGVNPQVNSFTIQQGGGTGFDNDLANISGAVLGASAQIFVPLGLYAGPVWYRYQGTVAALHNVVIADISGTIGGQWVSGTGMPGALLNISPNDAAEHSGIINLPRAACAFVLQAPVAGMTFSFYCAAQQAA